MIRGLMTPLLCNVFRSWTSCLVACFMAFRNCVQAAAVRGCRRLVVSISPWRNFSKYNNWNHVLCILLSRFSIVHFDATGFSVIVCRMARGRRKCRDIVTAILIHCARMPVYYLGHRRKVAVRADDGRFRKGDFPVGGKV